MTKLDIRNYLESIYNVEVAKVNTRIQLGWYAMSVCLSVCLSVQIFLSVFNYGAACNFDLGIAMAHPWSATGEMSNVVPLLFKHFGR